MDEVYEKAGKVFVRIHLTPSSRRPGLLGARAGRVRIGVKEPPVDGRANASLISSLAELVSCSRSHIFLEQGEGSREKLVSFSQVRLEDVLKALKLKG